MCGRIEDTEVVLHNSGPSFVVYDDVHHLNPAQTPLFTPNLTLSLPTADGDQHYRLCGVIYHGGHHFTARVIETSGRVWSYDSVNRGHLFSDRACVQITEVTTLLLQQFGVHNAILYVYASNGEPVCLRLCSTFGSTQNLKNNKRSASSRILRCLRSLV